MDALTEDLIEDGFELIETHISRVFLKGDRVYQVKKPVALGFLDFRSLDDRKRFCEAELTLNRRLASDVYLGVVPITRGPDGKPVPGGTGAPLEWAVHMRRLDPAHSFQSLLAAGIFFDFRALWGEASLAHELRNDVANRARATPRFLKQMTDNALRNRPPLNWYGDLQPDPRAGNGIDLKLHGTAIVVDGARIFALASGVMETNTIERLEGAAASRGLPDAEVRAWRDAFEFLQLIRLRTQHRRAAGVHAPSDNPNLVPLDDLSDLDRRIVKEALRQIRSLQQRLQLDYPG